MDLVHDKNLIVRPYALAAIHPHPRRVLLIGLSSGSWAQVLAHNPDVERLTVIEINPGYLGLIPRHAAVASLLANPKLEIVIDDGRRWLAAHPERRFDAVFSNTTWHWRSMATSLLSAEFLRLVGRHLDDGGVFVWNTTFSLEAQKTGCEVFPYGFRFLNSMVASNQPISLDHARWREALIAYRIDGKPIFDLTNPAHVDRLEEVLRIGPTPGTPMCETRISSPAPTCSGGPASCAASRTTTWRASGTDRGGRLPEPGGPSTKPPGPVAAGTPGRSGPAAADTASGWDSG